MKSELEFTLEDLVLADQRATQRVADLKLTGNQIVYSAPGTLTSLLNEYNVEELNRILREKLAKCPKVYFNDNGLNKGTVRQQRKSDTRTARLFDIKEIEK